MPALLTEIPIDTVAFLIPFVPDVLPVLPVPDVVLHF